MKKLLYVACLMRDELEVESNAYKGTVKIKLQWAKDQIGGLPVFETLEAAAVYAGSTDNILCFSIEADDA